MSGMGGMGNLFDMMRNAKDMVEKAKATQADMAKKIFEGSSGAGMVVATVNGLGELVGLKYEPAAITPDDPEMLADLTVAAVADARKKVAQMRQDTMREMTGGIDLSSMGIDLGGLMQ